MAKLSSQRRLASLIGALAIAASTVGMAVLTAPATAAVGDPLASFDAASTASIPQCSSGIGTGIAYDGDNLILSCWSSNRLERVDSVTHLNNGSLTIAGTTFIGAIAYDGGRDRLWACTGFTQVSLINLNTQSIDPSVAPFETAGCVDGLAYDGADDTLWVSGDVALNTQHFRTNGTLISNNSNSGRIGNCGNSGIAVGGSMLYLANNGCSQIYQVDKAFTTGTFVSGFPQRLEDLECDGNTFPGKSAIWVQDAYDRILNAYEIPAGSCEFGGGFVNTANAEGYAARARVDAVPLDTSKIARSFSSMSNPSSTNRITEQVVSGGFDIGVGRTSASSSKVDKTTTAKGSASVAQVDLNAGFITADAVTAKASATFNSATGAESGSTSSAGSGFVNLIVGGNPVSDSVPANTEIAVPGVGTVTLREEITKSVAGENVTLQVNMIHFRSDDGTIDIVVSSAFAGAGQGFESPEQNEQVLPTTPTLPPLPEPPVPLPPLPGVPGACQPGPLYQTGFEGGNGGFTVTGSAGWEFGVPTSGPGSAPEGTSVAATVLGGNYGNNVNGSIVSPAIDLTNFDPADDSPLNGCAGKKAVINFTGWMQTESYYDCGIVEVSTDNGASWMVANPSPDYNFSGAWCGGLQPAKSFSGFVTPYKAYAIDVTAHAGKSLQFRFHFASDGSVVYPGWYVDAVNVTIE